MRDGGLWWRPLHAPEGVAYGTNSKHDKVEPKDVLIVEDEVYLCDLIADVLEAEGHTARKAANGREALVMVQSRRPQIILLDLMMPVMDGWEFRRTQQSDPALATVPVVVLSALDHRRAADVDAVAFLKKPLDFDRLLELVRHYCRS